MEGPLTVCDLFAAFPSRKLVPLDVPVSLWNGQIRTVEFSINLDTGYYIEIELAKTPSLPRRLVDCSSWH